MTTTEVFAESSDGALIGRSNTYLSARAGTDIIDTITGGTADFQTGQSLASSIYRCKIAYLSFDVSGLPAGDNIDSVVLNVRGSEANTTNSPVLEVREYDFGTTVESGDFIPGADFGNYTLLATYDTSGGWSTAGYNTFTESGTAFRDAVAAARAGTGILRVAVASDRFRLGTSPGSSGTVREDPRGYSSEQALTTSDPKLVIGHSAGATDLVVQDATHAHTADGPTLTQTHELTVQDAGHGHSSDAVALTQVHELAVADATHGHSADNVVLGADADLIVQDATHGHTADNLDLTQTHELVVADSTHGHSADALALTQVHELVVADASHAHAVDNLDLTQLHVLVVADALHGHSADSLALTQLHVLVVADALHAHSADEPVLTIPGQLGSATGSVSGRGSASGSVSGRGSATGTVTRVGSADGQVR